MDYTASEKVYIWLDSFALTDAEKRALLSEDDPKDLVRGFSKKQSFFEDKNKGKLFLEMQKSLTDDGAYFQGLLTKYAKAGVIAIPIGSPLYPKRLQSLAEKPLVFYAKGRTELLSTPLLAVVGSRRTPLEALKLTETICQKVSQVMTIVSGSADGADDSALCGAMKGTANAVCFLACGIDCVPNTSQMQAVQKKGLLLSPYPIGTPVQKFSYEYRNKLLAWLADGVLVVGAGEKSGALTTARYAVERRKKVFAFPYAPASANGVGCNALIKAGATLTETATDILEQFGLQLKASATSVALNKEEKAVLNALREDGALHVAVIAQKTGIPVYQVSGVLSALEMKGCVARLGGNTYSAVSAKE